MIVLAIDPGPVESAWVRYDTRTAAPVDYGKAPNHDVLDVVRRADAEVFAVEMVASYGMAVGAEVFDTCVWIGRFIEARLRAQVVPFLRRVFRREVKLHLCGDSRAKDANIRQAIIDRYGATREDAIGRKATPGPLYGITGDVWAALGVAITAAETAP